MAHKLVVLLPSCVKV